MNIQNLQTQFADTIVSEKQNEELEALIIPGGSLENPQAALDVYRAGYFARLTESLEETFESLWAVLGDEDFFKICQDYIEKHASNSYNLSDYGQQFPEFLDHHTALESFPFLKDLARFELVFQKIFHSEKPHLEKCQKLLTQITDKSIFSFLSSCSVFQSSYAISKIHSACREALSYENLEIHKPECCLMLKSFDGKIQTYQLFPWQYEIFIKLMDKNPLVQTLQTSKNDAGEPLQDLEVEEFFKLFGSLPLICGIDNSQ